MHWPGLSRFREDARRGNLRAWRSVRKKSGIQPTLISFFPVHRPWRLQYCTAWITPPFWSFELENHLGLGRDRRERSLPEEDGVECPPLLVQVDRDPPDRVLHRIRVGSDHDLYLEHLVGLHLRGGIDFGGVALSFPECFPGRVVEGVDKVSEILHFCHKVLRCREGRRIIMKVVVRGNS